MSQITSINWSKNKLHNILTSKMIKYEIVIHIMIYVVYFLLMNYVHLSFVMNGIHSLLHFGV
jgi:hypothetical protein